MKKYKRGGNTSKRSMPKGKKGSCNMKFKNNGLRRIT